MMTRIFAVLLIICAFYEFVHWNDCKKKPMRVGDTTITCEMAYSGKQRELGLSGRHVLPPDHGMCLVWPRPGHYGLWMLDMHFPIDAVWLDDRYNVIYIEPEISPDSYPRIFQAPDHSGTLSILELPERFCEKHGVKVGDRIVW